MAESSLYGVHHVQLAMPVGGEVEARAFYGALLDMREVPKPPALAARGGCWFRAGGVELHLGVEHGFRAARKAQPAGLVRNLDGLADRWAAGGVAVRWDEGFPGYRRCYADDPWGNRLEFLEPMEPTQQMERTEPMEPMETKEPMAPVEPVEPTA